MPLRAVLGAAAGAALGAIVWALVALFANVEHGIIAWGVGGAVGFGAHWMGGRGTTSGLVCAGLTLLSIFAGKMLATHLLLKKEIRQELASNELYSEWHRDASDFAKLQSEDEHREFMATHGFSLEEAADITEEDLANFRAEWVPQLRDFQAEGLTEEAWIDAETDRAYEAFTAEMPLTEIVTEELNLIDAIFALLGIVTAFKLGEGSGGATARTSGRHPRRRGQASQRRMPDIEPPDRDRGPPRQ